jgi:hypothetical protein
MSAHVHHPHPHARHAAPTAEALEVGAYAAMLMTGAVLAVVIVVLLLIF